MRAGLKAVLGTAKDIEVIGEGSTARMPSARGELDPMCDRTGPLDGDGRRGSNERAGRKEEPRKVLILTMHAEVPISFACGEGASGYLVKMPPTAS